MQSAAKIAEVIKGKKNGKRDRVVIGGRKRKELTGDH